LRSGARGDGGGGEDRRSTYSEDEIDALGIYSPDTDKCYLLPAQVAAGRATVSLRLGPTRNNQVTNVRWAKDFVGLSWDPYPVRSARSKQQGASGLVAIR
jgi:hypothetical protein